MVYWTKRVVKDGFPTTDLEPIKEETELDFCPDGDGFEVNMNGISYKTYLKNPTAYQIVGGKLTERE